MCVFSLHMYHIFLKNCIVSIPQQLCMQKEDVTVQKAGSQSDL